MAAVRGAADGLNRGAGAATGGPIPPQILEHATTNPTRRGAPYRGLEPAAANMAQQLTRGMIAARHPTTLPFEPSLEDREPKFYAPPQPALPPKDMVEPPPEFYQPPGRDA